jgi:hypothetical protein
MPDSVHRTYTIRFNGQPNIQKIQKELANAAKSFNEYTTVAITSNGSTDPELEEISFTMEADI